MQHNRMMQMMVAIAAVAVLFAVTGRGATALYPLLLLACPLMMVFMMRGMDHGRGGDDRVHDQDHSTHSDSPH